MINTILQMFVTFTKLFRQQILLSHKYFMCQKLGAYNASAVFFMSEFHFYLFKFQLFRYLFEYVT